MGEIISLDKTISRPKRGGQAIKVEIWARVGLKNCS